MGFLGSSNGEEYARNVKDLGSIPGLGRFLEKDIATPFNILAWRIPWIEEPGGLQSVELQRVRHDWATNTFMNSYNNLKNHYHGYGP